MNTIDYSKPEPRDDQEAFDIVARHLLTQGKRSEKYGKCAYRGDDGTKCAIGALIPDDVYRAEWDPTPNDIGIGTIEMRARYPESATFLPSPGLARALQSVHDLAPPEEWISRLRYVAETFGLDASIVDRVAAATRAAETDGEGGPSGSN